jgi:hypothetical protein
MLDLILIFTDETREIPIACSTSSARPDPAMILLTAAEARFIALSIASCESMVERRYERSGMITFGSSR